MKKLTMTVVFLFLLSCGFSFSADEKYIERYGGRIMDQTGAVPGFSATFVTIMIEKYNTAEEILDLAKLLAQKDQEAVLKEIEKREVGRIRIGNRLSYPLSATRTFENEGKKIIRAMTDRPINIAEAMADTRSTDYPFGFMELVLDAEGKGEGVLVVAAKIEMKDGKLEMESYGREPFRLTNITKK